MHTTTVQTIHNCARELPVRPCVHCAGKNARTSFNRSHEGNMCQSISYTNKLSSQNMTSAGECSKRSKHKFHLLLRLTSPSSLPFHASPVEASCQDRPVHIPRKRYTYTAVVVTCFLHQRIRHNNACTLTRNNPISCTRHGAYALLHRRSSGYVANNVPIVRFFHPPPIKKSPHRNRGLKL